MAKDEQGFFDWLVEDICDTIEIKGAVEATRDENGKVDKWAATGLAMGLGHTSDDELATLAGFLGAEGAFDDDTDDAPEDDSDSFDDDFADISVPVTTSRYTFVTADYMSEEEYERKKKDIIFDFKVSVWIIAVAALGVFFGLIWGIKEDSDSFEIICLAAFAVLGRGAYYFCNQKNRNLEKIEKEHLRSLKAEMQKEEKRRKQEAVPKELEALKDYAGTADLSDVVAQIYRKTRSIFEIADRECNITEPTYDRSFTDAILSGLLYAAVKKCDINDEQKAAVYRLSLAQTAVHSECTGELLFSEYHPELIRKTEEAAELTLTAIVVAAYKSDNGHAVTDLTKTICAMMLRLGDEINRKTYCPGFGRNGACVTLETAENAMQKVTDEHLLGEDERGKEA